MSFLVLATVNPRAFPVSVSMKKGGISCERVHEEKPFRFDGVRGGVHRGRRHVPPISFTTCILRRMLTDVSLRWRRLPDPGKGT